MTRLFQLLFWGAVAAILFFTLRPITVVVPGSDKTQHAISFGLLMLLAAPAFPRARPVNLAVALSALGAAIEFIQPYFGRSDDIRDWVADTIGIAIALFPVLVGRRLLMRSKQV